MLSVIEEFVVLNSKDIQIHGGGLEVEKLELMH